MHIISLDGNNSVCTKFITKVTKIYDINNFRIQVRTVDGAITDLFVANKSSHSENFCNKLFVALLHTITNDRDNIVRMEDIYKETKNTWNQMSDTLTPPLIGCD